MKGEAKILAPSPARFPISQVLAAAVIIQDIKGRITFFNTAAEVHSGYPSAEVLGRRPWDFLIAEEDVPLHRQAFQDLETSRIQLEMETVWVTRLGERRIMRWSNAPVLDEAGNLRAVVNTYVDITEDKESARQLAKAKAELERAVRARDDFLTIASHELRTPITPLVLQIQMMKKYLKAERAGAPDVREKFRKLLDLSEAQVKKLNKLIGSLLDVSQIKGGTLTLKLEETDLSGLVKNILARYEAVAKSADCVVRLDVEPRVTGRWDRLRIEQAVVNLLTNAFKYGRGSPVEIRVWREGATANFSVRDRGPGIAPDVQGKLFNLFERDRSKAGHEGLGLGLYIAKEIATAHRGSIGVESGVGAGSVFRLKIPAALDKT